MHISLLAKVCLSMRKLNHSPACDNNVWPPHPGTLPSTWSAWRTLSARAWWPSRRPSARQRPTRSGRASLMRSTTCCDDFMAALLSFSAPRRIGVCTFFGYAGWTVCFLLGPASQACVFVLYFLPMRRLALMRPSPSVQLHLCFGSAAGTLHNVMQQGTGQRERCISEVARGHCMSDRRTGGGGRCFLMVG